ncbi:Hypothetical_protein [Hexamita inflata]|uniref:Hypothetical_protein n=1 Tax=Hexamita inflata TaxID=28002 RepID=A0ABP1GY51_9EUKA
MSKMTRYERSQYNLLEKNEVTSNGQPIFIVNGYTHFDYSADTQQQNDKQFVQNESNIPNAEIKQNPGKPNYKQQILMYKQIIIQIVKYHFNDSTTEQELQSMQNEVFYEYIHKLETQMPQFWQPVEIIQQNVSELQIKYFFKQQFGKRLSGTRFQQIVIKLIQYNYGNMQNLQYLSDIELSKIIDMIVENQPFWDNAKNIQNTFSAKQLQNYYQKQFKLKDIQKNKQ